jgi:hypothetical protein
MKAYRSTWAASVAITLAATLSANRAYAATVVLSAADSGFVTEMGGSSKGDGTVVSDATNNYSAGRELHYSDGGLGSALAPMDRKNYFVFDLSSIPAMIVDAKLLLYAGPAVAPPFPGGAHGYESADPSEAYGIAATMDFAGALADAAALKTGNEMGGPMDFDDPTDPLVGMAKSMYTKLATGPVPLAATVLSPMTDGLTVPLPFTPPGLGYLNSFLGAKVILGGIVPTAMPPVTPQSVFGFTGPDIAAGDPLTPKLEVTFIPESSTAALLAIGVAAIGRRRVHRQLGQPTTRLPGSHPSGLTFGRVPGPPLGARVFLRATVKGFSTLLSLNSP